LPKRGGRFLLTENGQGIKRSTKKKKGKSHSSVRKKTGEREAGRDKEMAARQKNLTETGRKKNSINVIQGEGRATR